MGARISHAIAIGRMTVRETLADDVGTLAASLAYRFLFALFPFFIFLAALSGMIADWFSISDPTQQIMDRLGDALPDDASSVLETQLRGVVEAQNPGLLSIGALTAIWAAAGGMGSTMNAMNRTYDVEETRPIWHRYLLAIGLTVFGGLFVITAFVLLIAGDRIIKEISEAMDAGMAIEVVFGVVRFAAAAALLLVATAFLYWVAPNAELGFRWISPGAVLFVVVWAVATLLFGFYVSNFGSYNATYGALGGVIILMLWFYLTSYILLVGAELNSVVGRATEPEATPPNTEADALPQPAAAAANKDAPVARAAGATARGRMPNAHRVAPRGARGNGHAPDEHEKEGEPGIVRRSLGALVTLAAVRRATSKHGDEPSHAAGRVEGKGGRDA
jgi:membrane protein